MTDPTDTDTDDIARWEARRLLFLLWAQRIAVVVVLGFVVAWLLPFGGWAGYVVAALLAVLITAGTGMIWRFLRQWWHSLTNGEDRPPADITRRDRLATFFQVAQPVRHKWIHGPIPRYLSDAINDLDSTPDGGEPERILITRHHWKRLVRLLRFRVFMGLVVTAGWFVALWAYSTGHTHVLLPTGTQDQSVAPTPTATSSNAPLVTAPKLHNTTVYWLHGWVLLALFVPVLIMAFLIWTRYLQWSRRFIVITANKLLQLFLPPMYLLGAQEQPEAESLSRIGELVPGAGFLSRLLHTGNVIVLSPLASDNHRVLADVPRMRKFVSILTEAMAAASANQPAV